MLNSECIVQLFTLSQYITVYISELLNVKIHDLISRDISVIGVLQSFSTAVPQKPENSQQPHLNEEWAKSKSRGQDPVYSCSSAWI